MENVTIHRRCRKFAMQVTTRPSMKECNHIESEPSNDPDAAPGLSEGGTTRTCDARVFEP